MKEDKCLLCGQIMHSELAEEYQGWMRDLEFLIKLYKHIRGLIDEEIDRRRRDAKSR